MGNGQNAAGIAPTTPLTIKGCTLVAAVLSAYCIGGLVPVLPRIEAAFGSTPGAGALVRLLISGIGVSMIVGAPLAGLATGRWGRRRVLIASLLVFAIAGTLGGLLNNLWLIVASRIVFGLGAAGTGTLLFSLTAELEESERRKWFGLATTVGTFAGVLLYPLSGFLGNISWRLPFLVHAIALAVVPVVIIGVRDRPAAPVPGASGTHATGGAPWPLFVMAMAMVFGALSAASSLFVPFQLRDIGVTDPSKTGLLLMPLVAMLGVVSLCYRRIRDHLSAEATFVAGFAAMGVGITITGLASVVPVLVAGLILLGAGSGAIAPHYMLLATTSGPPERAPRNLGLTRSAYYIGPLLAQITLEPLVAATRASMALFVLATLGIVTAVVVSRRRPLATPLVAPSPTSSSTPRDRVSRA